MHKVQKKFQSANNEYASKNANTIAAGFISYTDVSNHATDLYATTFKQII